MDDTTWTPRFASFCKGDAFCRENQLYLNYLECYLPENYKQDRPKLQESTQILIYIGLLDL